MGENRQLAWIDFPVCLVYEWEVYARDELYGGGIIWVVLATVDLEAVDPVLMSGLRIRWMNETESDERQRYEHDQDR